MDWKDEFEPQILARGKKYFEEGRVSGIIQYGNRIVAHVSGSEDYCVEVELPGGVPDSWLCTCPYAVKGNCKHKAALLYAVEAGEYTFTGEPPEQEEDIPVGRISLPWYDAIEKMPADTLRKALLHFADQNTEVREILSIWYLHGLPDGLLEQWKGNLLTYARDMSAGRRYIPEDDVYYFLNGMRFALRERLPLLRKVGATMDAFYYLGTVFEIASKWVNVDAEGYFEDFYYDCAEHWDLLFSEATKEQQEQMHTWFWEHRAAFFAHVSDATGVDFLYHPWSDELERKSLEIIDGLIESSHSNKELELLMECRINVMEFLDCSIDEERDFWNKHLTHDYARHRLLEDYYMDPEDHPLIVALLSQLKEMDGEDLPRLTKDNVWLAKLYREKNCAEDYAAERMILLTENRKMLEAEIPKITDKTAARKMIACLDSLRSLEDKEIDQMIEELVDKLCSNPAIARKGIVELLNAAGYEWPKVYHFPS